MAVISLNGNGGTFPDGTASYSADLINGYVRLPDWSIVDRPGYRLTGWNTSSSYSGTDHPMCEKYSGSDTLYAKWIEDRTDSYTDLAERRPMACVRIYRSLTEYVDVTRIMSSLPDIKVAENREGQAAFTVAKGVNASGEIDPAKNILSPTCAMWRTFDTSATVGWTSSGTVGMVRPGMYVQMRDIGTDGHSSYLMDGFVSTVKGTDTDVEITVGDRRAFLGKSGTWLRRNYRNASSDRIQTMTVYDSSDDPHIKLSDVPQGSSVTSPSVSWAVVGSGTRASVSSITYVSQSTGQSAPIYSWTGPMPTFGEHVIGALSSLTLTLRFAKRVEAAASYVSGSVNVSVGGRTFSSGYFERMNSGSASLTKTVTVDTTVNGISTLSTDCNFSIRVYMTDTGVSTSAYGFIASDGDPAYSYAGTFNISPGGDVTSNGEIRPSSAATSAYTFSNWAEITVTSGTVATASILSDMAEAIGMIPMVNVQNCDAALNSYRTGGSYALDYAENLADIADSSGRMLAYASRGYLTPVLIVSDRPSVSDGAQMALAYGGDNSDRSKVSFMDFSPSMTLKNRPGMVTLRGTMSETGSSDSETIIVSVEDTSSTDVRYGVLVEQVASDTNVNSVYDAVQSAYSELTSRSLDEWEGTVTLPGIVTGLIDGPAGGVPVSVTDSRNGLSAYKTLVRQAEYDYTSVKTVLTIGNYDRQYRNALSNTEALALKATDAATESSDSTLFNTQYVNAVYEGAIAPVSPNVMTIITSDGGSRPATSVTAFNLPGGGHMYVGRCKAVTETIPATTAYAVSSVTVNGTSVLFDVSVRPDFIAGQLLIICITTAS